MYKTKEEQRAYAAKWREKNRDKIREYAKNYYWASEENKKNSNAASKSWYDRNKEKVMKRTSKYLKENKNKNPHWKCNNTVYNLFNSAKSRAKKENLPFNITSEDIIIPSHCPILGVEFPENRGPSRLHNPSLDRIIPKLGYVKGNIAVISLRANMLKNDMDLETARKLVTYLEKYSIS